MTDRPHIPQGLSTVLPYLTVDGARELITFLESAFGAQLVEITEDADKVVHAKVQFDESIVELSDGNETFGPRTASLHYYVVDTDASYQSALDAGATSLYEPADMPYGERSAGVVDPKGNHWYLATALTGEASAGEHS